jgi:hypothetical protein
MIYTSLVLSLVICSVGYGTVSLTGKIIQGQAFHKSNSRGEGLHSGTSRGVSRVTIETPFVEIATDLHNLDDKSTQN